MKRYCLLLGLLLLLPLQAEFTPLIQLKTQAESGDLAARVALAHRRFHSLGDTRDPDLIYQAFAEGAEAGLADAHAGLALCLSSGFGCNQNQHQAYHQAKLSADLGSARGYYALASLAMNGQPVSANRGRIQEYLNKAAALGDHEAKLTLATYKFTKNGFSKITNDVGILEELAKEGHEEAQFSLYSYYKNSAPEKADKYLKQAIESGYPSAVVANAFTRFPGQDFTIRENTREENEHALDCYRKAFPRADSGNLFEYAYGLFLHPELAEEGEDWQEIMGKAARLGSIEAADILAWSYYKPNTPGVDPDYAKAEALLLKTLNMEKRGRYHTLGLIYLDGGYGAEKNPERAFKLLGRYADEIPYVYRILGKILTDWEPLQGKDAYKIRAYACYLRYQTEVPEPTEGLFEERTSPLGLTAAQIAEAQKLADDGYPTKPDHTLWAANDGPYAPDTLAKDALAAYREKGIAGMRSLLDERFTELHIAKPRHPKLFPENTRRFSRLFKEAQTGSGRNDPAWAAALYEWLFDNAERYPVSFSRFNIMNNYALALTQGGQRARAKVFLNQMSEILALSGFQTKLSEHPENRPFTHFPSVNSPNYREVPHFRLDQASFLNRMADQALVEGRWKDSLAQAHAHIDVVQHKFASDQSIKSKLIEWQNQMVSSRDAKARVFDLLQFHDLADELHHLNSDDDFSKSYGGRSRHTSKVALINNQIRKGEVDTGTITELEVLVKKIARHRLLTKASRLEAQLVLTQALFEIGRNEEAWHSLSGLRKSAPNHLPFHLLWVEQKLATGELAGLEDLLISQLQWVRSQGEKVSEVKLHLLYSQLLSAQGRFNEAIQVQREAIRLLDSFDLYTWLPLAHLELADLYSRAGNPAEAKAQQARAEQILNSDRKLPDRLAKEAKRRLAGNLPGPGEDEEVFIPVELQPSNQLCVPLQGFAARGLFLLKNPSRETAKGQFQVKGRHLKLTDDSNNQSLLVTIDPAGKASKTSPLNLSLEPGGQVFVDLSTTSTEVDRDGDLTLRWIPEKGDLLESIWTYEKSSADGIQSAVVDAGLFVQNPFFSVPIYHLVQNQDGFSKPMDLKIIASRQARIEVYDENNHLIFIDANGDGDLTDTGDLLVIDENSDGMGDLKVTREGARSSRFYVQVAPAATLPDEGLTLTYQIRDNTGRWRDSSRDLIRPHGK